MPYIAPTLLAVLFASHIANWFRQASVLGYFQKNAVDITSPLIQWLDPIFLAGVFAALLFLFVVQRRSLRLQTFNRYETGSLGLAAIVIGAISITQPFVAASGLVSPSNYVLLVTATAIYFLSSLVFKVLGVVVIWKAFRSVHQAEQLNSHETSRGAAKLSFGLIVVLAAAMHLLFPMDMFLSLVPSKGLAQLLKLAAAGGLAWYFLYRGVADGVVSIKADSILVRTAFWFAVIFLIVAPFGAIWSAIPYGGGGVPIPVRSVFAVTQILGIVVIYRGLIRGAT